MSTVSKTILYLRTEITFDDNLPKAGGSVSHTVGVIKGFTQLGYQVIGASSCMIPIFQTLPLQKFKQLYVPRILGPLRWFNNCILSNFFFFFQAQSLIRKHNPAYLYQRYSYANLVGILLSKFYRIPIILEYNGSEVWCQRNWGEKKQINIIKRFLFNCSTSIAEKIEQKNLQNANFLVVVSQALKDQLIEQGITASKVLVNPNGVDPEQYDPTQLEHSRTRIRHHLRIEDKFVFGFVGTFSAWHGIERIAEMVPLLVKKKPQAHFIFIGDGPLLDWLKHEMKSYEHAVTFTGLLSSEQSRDYLAACDAFLSPTQPNADGSRFFGSPTKVFEYLSFGKPTIASDLEQLKELIPPTTGILVPPKNTQGFVQAATRLIELSDSARNTMGRCARERACMLYSWKHHVAKITDFVIKDDIHTAP